MTETLFDFQPSPDTRNMPGHRDAGPDHWHFLGHGCLECDTYCVTAMNRRRVEDFYHKGLVSQDLYEAYMWIWSTSAHRYGSAGDWTPTSDEVRHRGEMIRTIHEAERHGGGSRG